MNQNHEQFGDPRLVDTFSETEEIHSAEDSLAFIQSRVNEFGGSEPQHDDIIMVYIQIGDSTLQDANV